MKILTATLTLIFTLAAGSVSFAQCPQSDCCGTHHCNACDNGSHAKRRHHNSNNDYLVSNFKVYYRGQVVEGATASSFSVIGEGYAKDNFRVFYNGQKIDGATASSFTLLGCGYAKDSFKVFYKGQKMDGATASSFTLLGEGYTKDSFRVFYKAQKIIERITQRMLESDAELSGIYITSSGRTGVCRAIEHANLPKKVHVIIHDVTSKNILMVQKGIVDFIIGQDTLTQGTLPIRLLYDYLERHQFPKNRINITEITVKFRCNV